MIDPRPQQCTFFDLKGLRIGELWISGHDYDLPLRTYSWHGRLFQEGVPPRGINEFTEVAIPETIQ